MESKYVANSHAQMASRFLRTVLVGAYIAQYNAAADGDHGVMEILTNFYWVLRTGVAMDSHYNTRMIPSLLFQSTA